MDAASGPFARWLTYLTGFQRRRGAGSVTDPWDELGRLEARAEQLVSAGLDLREAARCLCQFERAALLYEGRHFEEALAALGDAEPRLGVPREIEELIEANCELLHGNVLLTRDELADAAAQHFKRAIRAAGPCPPEKPRPHCAATTYATGRFAPCYAEWARE